MKVALIAAAVFALAASPGVAQTVAGDIERANEQLAHAFNEGDAATVARMYTERAMLLPPEADMIEGREAIQTYWQGAIDAGIKNLSLKSLRVDEYGGDAAREIGRFSFDAPGSQGRPSRVDGKYVVVWRKSSSGGEWRIDSDIWNLTEPPEPEVATGTSTAPPAVGSGSPSPSR